MTRSGTLAGLRSLRGGLRSLLRNWGLVPLVLTTNLGLALLLAFPFALRLEHDLAHQGAARRMLHGFDYDWWSRWSEDASGPAAGFAPDLAGIGFVLRGASPLLEGRLPGGLFARASGRNPGPDPEVLGLGVLYLLIQVYLTGGLLSVFRAPDGGWSMAALLHGCGFYLGRLVRVSLLALAAAGLVFALHAPLARWLDGLAREAVSERTALALLWARYGLVLVALALVHMVSSYAKAIVVCEERSSALLALWSSLGFCARNLAAVLGQYLVVIGAGAALLAIFAAADASVAVTGFRTQLVALVLLEAFVAGLIALRLGLVASQVSLLQERGR